LNFVSRPNIPECSSAFSCCEHCVTSTNYRRHLGTVEVCFSRLQESEWLLRVSCYLHFGTPEFSLRLGARVSVLQCSADVTNGCKRLDVLYIVLPRKVIRRRIYLTFYTLFPDEREHYSSCNAAAHHGGNMRRCQGTMVMLFCKYLLFLNHVHNKIMFIIEIK
jgi:hypothetical protein